VAGTGAYHHGRRAGGQPPVLGVDSGRVRTLVPGQTVESLLFGEAPSTVAMAGSAR
jgi:hypothetical protein